MSQYVLEPHEADGLAWRKSTRSSDRSDCVQVAPVPGVGVAVRHSKNPDGLAILYSGAEWEAFLDGARRGEFDDMI
jgi:hypothetical protein